MSAKDRRFELSCGGRVHRITVHKVTRIPTLHNHTEQEENDAWDVIVALGGDICSCVAVKAFAKKSNYLRKVSFRQYLRTIKELARLCSAVDKAPGAPDNAGQVPNMLVRNIFDYVLKNVKRLEAGDVL